MTKKMSCTDTPRKEGGKGAKGLGIVQRKNPYKRESRN